MAAKASVTSIISVIDLPRGGGTISKLKVGFLAFKMCSITFIFQNPLDDSPKIVLATSLK
jgi:hypothetical protein